GLHLRGWGGNSLHRADQSGCEQQLPRVRWAHREMAVHQFGHHAANLAAAIATTEAVRQLFAHLSRGLKIHSVQNTQEELQQNLEPLGWWQLGNAGQGFLEKLFAIGV
ncbi:MAG: hypothetical protein ACREH8_16950, partial [Opitutaceae bacterium]